MRQDVYRVAYDEAHAELTEIRNRFEQLRARKERLEGVVAVLGPMLGLSISASAPPEITPAGEPEQISKPDAYSFNQVQVPMSEVDETGGDPFKRRVRNALRTAV